MTLKEIRDKIAATKAKLREVLPNAETEEQRAEVLSLEERLNAEEAELAAAEKWDADQARIQARFSTGDLLSQAPRRHTRQSALDADPDTRENGAIVLTREFIGDILDTRDLREQWDAVYQLRNRTPVDEEVTRSLLRIDSMDAQHPVSQEYRAAISDLQKLHARVVNPDLNVGTTSDALGGFLIPPDTAAYAMLQLRMKAFMGVEREALVMTHTNDRDFPIPQLDQTAEAGESRDEGEGATARGDFALTRETLGSHRVTSKTLLVPAAVLRSFAVEAEPLIMFLLGESAGRRKAAMYATGDGTAPNASGIIGAKGLDVSAYRDNLSVKYDISDGRWNKSAAGTADATSQAPEIPIEILNGLDSAYWGIGSTVVMSPSMYQAMRAVVDGDGRYLWPELANRHPSADGAFMWQGLRIRLDPNYADIALGVAGANKKVMTVGDHKGFFIRNIAGMRMSRNVWAKDEEDAVRFVLHCYTDSKVAHPWGLRLIRVTVQA